MIKFENVSHCFGRKTPVADKRKVVLNGVDFQLRSGEIICLLGPSGCGKTTMVNLIMGALIPTEGVVKVMGEQAPYKTARARVGYMPQEDALYEDITAADNLKFFGAMNGMKNKDIKSRIGEMLALGRLEAEGKTLVSNFSGGMKRRLSLGVALMHDPDLLVLDEPTVGLDPDHRRRIWDEFDKMAAQGKTILVTTHVMDEAERCSRIAMLYNGKIIAEGAPEEILKNTDTTCLEDAFLALEAGYEAEREVSHHE